MLVKSWASSGARGAGEGREPKSPFEEEVSMSDHRVLNRIGIIGGHGLFGSWMRGVLERRGIEVLISDVGTELSNEALVERADAVIVSVPIGVTEGVLREIAPAVRAGQLVIDLTSVKTPFLSVLAAMPSEVLSLHPMFSPSLLSVRGQSCIVCHVREGSMGAVFLELLSDEGIALEEMAPEQHDKLMAVVQGMTHFQAIVAGHCMATIGFNPADTLGAASPVYRMRLVMIGRILAQSPRLYAEIQIFNPYVREIVAALERSSRVFADAIEARDVDRFVAEFERARAGLAGFERAALEESDRVIAALAAG